MLHRNIAFLPCIAANLLRNALKSGQK